MVSHSDDIPTLFPHRHPFLLIDRADIAADGHVIGYKAVTRTEPWFTGHFPDKPVLPGVILLEAMAQTGRFLNSVEATLTDARLARIDNVRFHIGAVPGDVIRMEASQLAALGQLSKFHVEATIAGNLCAEADFLVHSVFESQPEASGDSHNATEAAVTS